MQIPRRKGLQMSLSVKCFSFPLSSPTRGWSKIMTVTSLYFRLLVLHAREEEELKPVHEEQMNAYKWIFLVHSISMSHLHHYTCKSVNINIL